MTNHQLKELEDKLWDSANSLRAHGGLKAADYAVPVLGLIFLKFADNKYSQHEEEIKAVHHPIATTAKYSQRKQMWFSSIFMSWLKLGKGLLRAV